MPPTTPKIRLILLLTLFPKTNSKQKQFYNLPTYLLKKSSNNVIQHR